MSQFYFLGRNSSKTVLNIFFPLIALSFHYMPNPSGLILSISRYFLLKSKIWQNMVSLKIWNKYSQIFLKMKIPVGFVLSHHFKGTISRRCKRLGSPKTWGFLLKAKCPLCEKPRNAILFLFSFSQWPSQKLYLNHYVSDSGYCRVSSRIPLNIFTTNVTLKELSYISLNFTFHFIQVTIFNILETIDVYIPDKCLLQQEESYKF